MDRAFIRCLSALIGVLLVSSSARAAAHAKPTLIADVSTVKPGETFHVAVAFAIDPGWHIYWTNPGDAGLPTKVAFTGTGVSFTPLSLPAPTRFDQAGGVVAYGYEDHVMLLADAVVPTDAKPGSTIDLAATASWLVCSDVCIPGKGKISLTLPVGEKSAPSDYAKDIADWLAKVPRAADAQATPQFVAAGNGYNLLINWKEAVSHVDVFPNPPADWQIDHTQTPLSNSTGDGSGYPHTAWFFTAKSLDPKSAGPLTLPLVIAYDDAHGQRHGIEWTGRLP